MLSSCYVRHKENELYQLMANATEALLILEPFKISDRLAIDTETTGLDALGDILKLSFGKLLNALKGTGAKLIGIVHDEILLECPIDITNRAAQTLNGVMVEMGEAYLYPISVEVEIKIANVGQKIDFLLSN